jgi:hypothetical protein
MKANLMKTARQLGEEQRRPRPVAIRAQLAFIVAEAVIDGKWSPEDAADIYASYYGRGRKQGSDSLKVQVSKLHAVMLLAQGMGRPAFDLLARVRQLHANPPADMLCLPLFEAMIETARAQLKRVKPLDDTELIALVCKPKKPRKPKKGKGMHK